MELGPGRAHGRRTGSPSGQRFCRRNRQTKCFSTLMAGVLLCATSPKALHIASIETCGLGSVALEPGYAVGITIGNFSFTAIRSISNNRSVPGRKISSLPLTADTNTQNSRMKSEIGVTLHAPNIYNSGQVCCQQAHQEHERLRSRLSPSHGPRHLSKQNKFIEVVMYAVVGLSGIIVPVNAFWSGRS